MNNGINHVTYVEMMDFHLVNGDPMKRFIKKFVI